MNKHIKDLLCFLDGSPTSVQASEQIKVLHFWTKGGNGI